MRKDAKMKVLMLNGSPNEKGCTYTALKEIADALSVKGIESEIINLGTGAYLDCIACGKCRELDNACIFGDDMINEIINKAKEADGFVFGSPVYYAHPSGRILSVLDRVFFAGGAVFAHKPGAAISSARRAGTTDAMDIFNKYFSISQMPIVSSTYWNGVHGAQADEVPIDKEGLQTMRNLAANMAWLLQCIELGKQNGVAAPTAQREHRTNFVRPWK